MKELYRLNPFFLKYKWRLLLGVLFVGASNYFRVLQPQVIRQSLDLVAEKITAYQALTDEAAKTLLFEELTGELFYLAAVFLGYAVLMGVFMYFMRQTIIVMSRLIEYDIRDELYQHYQLLSTAFYKRNRTGDLMARISEDVNKVRMYLGPAILYGINLTILFTFVIYSMFSVNATLSLYVLAPLPILSISIYYVSNLINKKSEDIQVQLAALTTTTQEVYSGIRVVKSYVQEEALTRHFDEQSELYKQKSMSLVKIEAFFHPLMLLLIGTSTVITVYVGGLQVAKGLVSLGNVAEFVIYVNMLTWPVTAIGWVVSIIQQASASQKRINEFLNAQPDIVNTSDNTMEISGDITFDDVSFTYPDTGIAALKNVSFSLKAGQKMAIIGRTGSGKTTIAELLLRNYDASSGDIKIDGHEMKAINLYHLRDRIGYVPQDVFLFSDTIANNIAFGRPGVSREKIEEFAKHASIYNEIAQLPEGFDTKVGERGVTLSGGQKQRTSLARALIKEPDILILDDSLSAVDTDTEKSILGYLGTALEDKTTIVITHRISGLLHFDHIIVLDEGRIVEAGTHEELLENGGYYRDLLDMQQEEDEEM